MALSQKVILAQSLSHSPVAVTSLCSGYGAYHRSGFFLHFMRNFEIKPKTYFIESVQMSVLKTF